MCVVVALHFGPYVPLGVMFPFEGLPLVAPVVAGLVFLSALRARLRDRGREHASIAHTWMWAAGIGGLWAIIQRLVFGGVFDAFTQACTGFLATQSPPPVDCHYLCTIAARGPRWLVRPVRLGRRRGLTILVNRQLMTANAFEDLLHERWPRFGRLCRRLYDWLALPICGHLRGPWISASLYLLMKPLEYLFALALLLCDTGDPEERRSKMYR